MEKVRVLGLAKCSHCDALVVELTREGVDFDFLDVDLELNTKLADRMEVILKTSNYPMVIIEKTGGAVYLYREDTYVEAKPEQIGYAVKIGCVSSGMMVNQIRKYIKK